ncbi:MAG: YihA family ribosome biogenesis GTP-binding protein [Oscillospiraceae bacterium]|nr:YihA family ribosome biogenesis GTP-binding protein [Oscillospiraceae bacterium]MBQ3008464.1 YihA family ribosome biogenesis GTP-binding protein [Oscillospiraceae bacterium]MBQ6851027.1 YihA family ribosome biogenesis GTP-binding protein [Oscillospiraceae bacterium]MBR6609420.1 YihA family ribosome biogenesis GTP-binding protein [Oscillospiraceae bacterium]
MIIKKAEFFAAFGTNKQLPASVKPEVVFSGRSNVGKSSLINKLCNRKNLARVSGEPGKTGTINFYTVNDFYIVDLPGYGFAKVSDKERQRWDKLINSYFETGRGINLVVQLIDCRREPSNDDYMMLEYLSHHNIPFIIALTKGDKLNKTQQNAAVEQFKEYCRGYSWSDVILTSVPKNIGIDTLSSTIEGFLGE